MPLAVSTRNIRSNIGSIDSNANTNLDSMVMRTRYEYRHTVTLDETNLLGNVYFAHYVRWQGHCRELFLRTYAPSVFAELDASQAIVTTRCGCEYLAELMAFDEVAVRMHAGEVTTNRLTLLFEYWRIGENGEELVARGEQQLAWLVRDGARFLPDQVPDELLTAIDAYLRGNQPAAIGADT